MNACHEMEERLNDHVEGQLPLPEQREVEQHLAGLQAPRPGLGGPENAR